MKYNGQKNDGWGVFKPTSEEDHHTLEAYAPSTGHQIGYCTTTLNRLDEGNLIRRCMLVFVL